MRNATGHPAAPLTSLQGTPYERLSTTLPCHFLHAGQTCTNHARGFVWEAYLRALPVYVGWICVCWVKFVGGFVCMVECVGGGWGVGGVRFFPTCQLCICIACMCTLVICCLSLLCFLSLSAVFFSPPASLITSPPQAPPPTSPSHTSPSHPSYLPVYVVPALLVHRRALVQTPGCWTIWRKIGVGVLRSSAFLALYCTLAWRGVLIGFERGVMCFYLCIAHWLGEVC